MYSLLRSYSEISTYSWVRVCICEMLILAELTEKGEEDVQRLNDGLIILQLVDGNIDHRAHEASVIRYVHVNFRPGEADLL